MGTGYLERLAARTEHVGSVLCLGIDPDPAAIPATLGHGVAAAERFAGLLLDAAGPAAAAVKVNLAFFEAFGSAGYAALERLRADVPADLPFIADAKRGDIATTAARQAEALVAGLGADAVTLSPYLGRDALEPFLAMPATFTYVLCRTSNPSAGEVQDVEVAGDDELGAPVEPLWARIARRAAAWDPGGRMGLVVGATAPAELERARAIAPGLAFLVPGVGAQGGAAAPVLAHGPATAAPAGGRLGGGLLVNVSRGIASALESDVTDRLEERLSEAARSWSARLAVLP
jgi:orotidine 5'-phosphate decarboxylase subfamily 2